MPLAIKSVSRAEHMVITESKQSRATIRKKAIARNERLSFFTFALRQLEHFIPNEELNSSSFERHYLGNGCFPATTQVDGNSFGYGAYFAAWSSEGCVKLDGQRSGGVERGKAALPNL